MGFKKYLLRTIENSLIYSYKTDTGYRTTSRDNYCVQNTNECNEDLDYYPNCYIIDDNTCGCSCTFLENLNID